MWWGSMGLEIRLILPFGHFCSNLSVITLKGGNLYASTSHRIKLLRSPLELIMLFLSALWMSEMRLRSYLGPNPNVNLSVGDWRLGDWRLCSFMLGDWGFCSLRTLHYNCRGLSLSTSRRADGETNSCFSAALHPSSVDCSQDTA